MSHHLIWLLVFGRDPPVLMVVIQCVKGAFSAAEEEITFKNETMKGSM